MDRDTLKQLPVACQITYLCIVKDKHRSSARVAGPHLEAYDKPPDEVHQHVSLLSLHPFSTLVTLSI